MTKKHNTSTDKENIVPTETRRNWTREEAVLAFLLYCKVPFGSIHKRNPEVIKLASTIGRSPSAVSMKMCNFGRFDPKLRDRGISGLEHGSKLDEIIWNEFSNNGDSLVAEAALVTAQYSRSTVSEQIDLSDLPDLPEGKTKERIVQMRLHQKFFREALLSSYYNSKCSITGIDVPELLVASHIKPWKVSNPKTERVNPSNGILLNALHDKAFDRGLITINTSYIIMVSPKLLTYVKNQTCKDWVLAFQGSTITLPEKFVPDKQFLEYHNDVIFVR